MLAHYVAPYKDKSIEGGWDCAAWGMRLDHDPPGCFFGQFHHVLTTLHVAMVKYSTGTDLITVAESIPFENGVVPWKYVGK